MSYQLRPAQRSAAKLLVGLYAESGRGKTWSSLLLARGFVGPKGRIAMIETESGRGEVYADVLPGGYDIISVREPFTPQAYGEAISAAEAARVDALIIDSASHEWESSGGVLDMAAKNQEDGKKGPLVWQRPKMDHAKHFVLRLMATPIPLVIVCMRAKYPMKEIKRDGKKEWIRSEELEPKQSEDILYEMLFHGWLDEEHKLHVTKFPRAIPAFKDLLRDGEVITEESGRRLASWATGQQKAAAQATPSLGSQPESPTPAPAPAAPISADQHIYLTDLLKEAGVSTARACKAWNVPSVAHLAAQDYQRALGWIEEAKKRAAAKGE